MYGCMYVCFLWIDGALHADLETCLLNLEKQSEDAEAEVPKTPRSARPMRRGL